KSLILSAPSSSEYCEWTWRWTNSAATAIWTRCLHTVTNGRRKAERAGARGWWLGLGLGLGLEDLLAVQTRHEGASGISRIARLPRRRGRTRSRPRHRCGAAMRQALTGLAEYYIAAVPFTRPEGTPRPTSLGPPSLGRGK